MCQLLEHATSAEVRSLREANAHLRAEYEVLQRQLANQEKKIQALTEQVHWYQNVRDWISSGISSGMRWKEALHFPEWLVVGGERIPTLLAESDSAHV